MADEILQQVQKAADAARLAAEKALTAANEVNSIVTTNIADHSTNTAVASPFVFLFSIFILAILVGYYVVWNVTPALHTPLMSVTNAISSVIIVGAVLAAGADVDVTNAIGSAIGYVDSRNLSLTHIFGFVAIVLASANIFGGFMVTQRMLSMYKSKKK